MTSIASGTGLVSMSISDTESDTPSPLHLVDQSRNLQFVPQNEIHRHTLLKQQVR